MSEEMRGIIPILNVLDLTLWDAELQKEQWKVFLGICLFFCGLYKLISEWKCFRSDETRINYKYYLVCT
jgi:hypothetical protein